MDRTKKLDGCEYKFLSATSLPVYNFKIENTKFCVNKIMLNVIEKKKSLLLIIFSFFSGPSRAQNSSFGLNGSRLGPELGPESFLL